MDLLAHVAELCEQRGDGHSVGQCIHAALLDDGPVGERIAVGHAELDDVGAVGLQAFHHLQGAVELRIARRAVHIEHPIIFAEEQLL